MEQEFPTADEALVMAVEWATGRRSHINTMITMEADSEQRPSTLAICEMADAQEVVKWSALAMALRDRERAIASSRALLGSDAATASVQPASEVQRD